MSHQFSMFITSPFMPLTSIKMVDPMMIPVSGYRQNVSILMLEVSAVSSVNTNNVVAKRCIWKVVS